MDNDKKNKTNESRDTRRARSSSAAIQTPGSSHSGVNSRDAVLLAQFAAAAGIPSHGLPHSIPYGSLTSQGGYPAALLPGFHDDLFNHGDSGHTQLPPLSSLDFPWHPLPPQHQGQHSYMDHFSHLQRNMASPGSSTSYPFGMVPTIPSNAPESDTTSQTSRGRPAEPLPSTSGSADPNGNQEIDQVTLSEEKRRRNTAASARFRIKKKQRTVNLERTVSDLTGRAEDLEREAADLRRENGWLKEIVMLKGSRLAGANLASHIMAESAQRAAEEYSQVGGSKHVSAGRDIPPSDDDSSEEEVPVSKRKGKSRKK